MSCRHDAPLPVTASIHSDVWLLLPSRAYKGDVKRSVLVLSASVFFVLGLAASGCSSNSSSLGVARLGTTTSTTAPPAGNSGGPLTADQMKGQLHYTACMRAHGLPKFPDPLPSGGFPRGSLPKHAAAWQTAQAACRAVADMAGMITQRGASSRQLTSDLLRYARCMRSHGEPGFPDPTGDAFAASASHPIDPNSVAFKGADRKCSYILGG